ncbi:hypothetical protein EVAR_53245_1 [Eumeta japonica]|uniref:Uncharacterized protein n=1 Tax=Eumeta variegata TaxID=151549 RepID=A0A4C1XDZ6_EUMVA|nr:hypothetical protein EVAR_53245_1 [Eumeta japonica]
MRDGASFARLSPTRVTYTYISELCRRRRPRSVVPFRNRNRKWDGKQNCERDQDKNPESGSGTKIENEPGVENEYRDGIRIRSVIEIEIEKEARLKLTSTDTKYEGIKCVHAGEAVGINYMAASRPALGRYIRRNVRGPRSEINRLGQQNPNNRVIKLDTVYL